MILVLAFLAGFGLGWTRADRRGGALADRLQWGAAHGFAFLLAAAVLALGLGFAGLSPL